jgi:hypothetical protein
LFDLKEDDDSAPILSELSELDGYEVSAELTSNGDYTINCINGVICGTWNTRTKVEILSTIILFVKEEYIQYLRHGRKSLNLYTVYKHHAVTYRAHPNYHLEWPWYDGCMVEHEPSEMDLNRATGNIDNNIESAYPPGFYPAKLLAFVKNVDDDQEESIFEIKHLCESKEHSMEDSCLTEWWNLEYSRAVMAVILGSNQRKVLGSHH